MAAGIFSIAGLVLLSNNSEFKASFGKTKFEFKIEDGLLNSLTKFLDAKQERKIQMMKFMKSKEELKIKSPIDSLEHYSSDGKMKEVKEDN